MTDERVTIPVRLDFDASAAIFSKAMAHLDNASKRQLDAVDFPAGLRELVRLRASQMNGCSYCADLHSGDAATAGESVKRINAVAVWRESPFFTARERAALAFTESLVKQSVTHVPDEDYAVVAEVFTPEEIGALVSLIVTINAWNMIGVSTRTWPVSE
ncbi:alkyl hydroperoxide reductase AhpD [Actinorhabdospora filicis]|uniref:Alkyl hydroperoxide reductase AhpD n=1 Tax=Actinorhabdospora filicis TaxID=1785913 RepID=A0A9W6SNR3_9ACTN|nr:carboxymuconolactone decarboxylase family protein [Actinorhabdospora filicis]GLZ79272.1 alkyl hydroperoxide reductase AhpD [Actinorhabdospora filicis]